MKPKPFRVHLVLKVKINSRIQVSGLRNKQVWGASSLLYVIVPPMLSCSHHHYRHHHYHHHDDCDDDDYNTLSPKP